MIVKRLNRLALALRRVLVVARPLAQIYTRTFVSTRHSYSEGYVQVLKRNAEVTPPIAFRTFGNKSELVKLLTALAFDMFSKHQTIEEWSAEQWDTLTEWFRLSLAARLADLDKQLHSFRSGASLDQYEIQGRIGDTSSCSTVYRARCGNTDIALKALFNFTCDDTDEMFEFKNFGPELITCQNVDNSLSPHPNIISIDNYFIASNTPLSPTVASEFSAVFEFGREETLYLEMPLYDWSLSQFLSQSITISDSQKLLILFQIISSVHHLVLNNTVHRDIKCDNILVTSDDSGGIECVLTDFGMAHNSLKVDRHPFGRKWGNPLIMPPEVVNSKITGLLDYTKSDIWCVGAISYELFGLLNPFTWLRSGSYSMSELPEFPSSDLELSYLIQNMLQVDPRLRWSSEKCLVYCGLMLWLPHLLQINPTVEVIAQNLAVLSYQSLASKSDNADGTSRLYFCQIATSEIVQSVLL